MFDQEQEILLTEFNEFFDSCARRNFHSPYCSHPLCKPERRGPIMQLYFYGNMSGPEIAELFKITCARVMQIISSCLKYLRQALRNNGVYLQYKELIYL